MSRLHLISFVLVALLSGIAHANEGNVEVGVRVLNLRSAPNGRRVRGLVQGETLEVIGSARNGSWLKVRVGSRTGYVFKRYTRPVPASNESGEAHTVDSRQGLNLRSSASSRGKKLGALDPGSDVEVLSTSGNWKRVRATLNGKTVTGWVYGRYLKKTPAESEGMAKTLTDALSGDAGSAAADGASPADASVADAGTDAPDADAPGADAPGAGEGSLDAAAHHGHDHSHGEEADAAGDDTSADAGTDAPATSSAGAGASAPTSSAPTTSVRPPNRPAYDQIPTSDASSLSLSKKQVTASSLNVRAEASTDAEIVGRLPYRTEVDVLELQGDWSRVRSGDTTGWVASRYLGEPGAAGSGRVVYGRYTVSDPLVRQVLERIATHTGRTVILTSGDRNYVPRGGSRTSLHLLKRAADFKVTGMSLSAVFDVIRNNRSTILAGAGYEVIYHTPQTNTGGPHLHVGRRGSSSDTLKTESRGRYRTVR